MTFFWLENLQEALSKAKENIGVNPSLLIKSKSLKYLLLGGFIIGSPLATYFTTAHYLNSKNQEILNKKEGEYESLLAENILSRKENQTIREENSRILGENQEIKALNQSQKDEFNRLKGSWSQKETTYKTQIKTIEGDKRNLESRIKRKILDISEILTPNGLIFFQKSSFVSSWDGLTKVESRGGQISSGPLFSSSLHFEETYDFFKNYNSYTYSSGNGLMKYLIPDGWSLSRSGAKEKFYFFLFSTRLEIKNIVESLKEPHYGSGHSTFNQHSILNDYIKPFVEEKEKMANWNHRITVNFLSNSAHHNIFNSPNHPSAAGWWNNSNNYRIKSIDNLDIKEIFKNKEDLEIALKILYFLHLTSQYTMDKKLKNAKNVVSFSLSDTKSAALNFLTNLYSNKLTINTNNFPSAESFLHYLMLKVLEYKNNFGKINLKDSVHPAFFSK